MSHINADEPARCGVPKMPSAGSNHVTRVDMGIQMPFFIEFEASFETDWNSRQ